jgi:dolichol-phosphate mannosyltransferase
MSEEATTVDIHAANLDGAAEIEPPRGGRISGPAADGTAVPGEGSAEAAGRSRPHLRLLYGMRRRANWLQLIRFSIVGASGYAVNLIVYSILVHPLAIEYRAAAAIAWMVAAGNNFVWNRHWTFRARDGQIHIQAMRFLLVSLVALGVNLAVLTLLVQAGGIDKVAAQALALAASTPLNFLGNKLWSFQGDLQAAQGDLQADLYSEPSPPQES